MPHTTEAARRQKGPVSESAARNRLVGVISVLALACAAPGVLRADAVPVRHAEGVARGFLLLRTLDGRTIADGDMQQVPHGAQLTSRITFRFRDGSLHDETAVYTQRQQFRLVSYKLVQRGRSFPHPMEMSIDAASGEVNVRYTHDDGDVEVESERLDLPPDIANGLMSVLLKNVRPGAIAPLSYVAATPKPRLVKLEVAAAAPDRFSTGGRGGPQPTTSSKWTSAA